MLENIKYIKCADNSSSLGWINTFLVTNKYYITGLNSHIIKIWDKTVFKSDDENKKPIKILRGHNGKINSIIMIGENEIASASSDGTIKVWNIENKEILLTLKGHSAPVMYLIKLENNIIASGSDDGVIKLWNLEENSEMLSHEAHLDGIIWLDKFENGILISSSPKGEVKFWSVQNQYMMMIKQEQFGSISSVIKIGEKLLAIFELYGNIYTLDIESWEKKLVYCPKNKPDEYIYLAEKIEDAKVVVCFDNNKLMLWDFNEDKISIIHTTDFKLYMMKYLENNELALLGYNNNCILNIETLQGYYLLKNKSAVVCIEKINKDKLVYAESTDIQILDIENNENSFLLGREKVLITSFAILDENKIVSASLSGNLKIWDISNREVIMEIKAHHKKVNSVIKVDEERIASSSNDGTIKIWDTNNGNKLLCLVGHSSNVTKIIKMSANIIASTSHDKTIRIWDLKDGKEIAMFSAHLLKIVDIIKLDENRIASASHDGSIKIWDIKNKTIMHTINCSNKIKATSYLESEMTLIVGLENGNIETYNLKNIPIVSTGYIENVSSSISEIIVLESKKIIFTNAAGDFGIIQKNIDLTKSNELVLKVPVKTLLLGNSGAGKTTFGYWFDKGEFNEDIRSTDGMQFFCVKADSMVEIDDTIKADIEYNIWDFGGQPEYQLSHQQNYKGAKIIFLMVDLHLPQSNDISNNFWIDRIIEHYRNKDISSGFKIIIIGTKVEKNSINMDRLEGIKLKIKNAISQIDVYCEIINVKELKEESCEFKNKLKGYIQEDLPGYNFQSFKLDSSKIMESILYLAKTEGYIQEVKIKGRLSSELKDEINIVDRSLISEINFLEETGKIEILSNTQSFCIANETQKATFGDDEFNEIENIANEKASETIILLRPYWKNIVAKSILIAAQNNKNVIGSLKEENLYGLNCKVEFDKFKRDDKKNSDADLFKNARNDKTFMKIFMKNIVNNFITYNIMYRKLGMFVFPSRFNSKNLFIPDSSLYRELSTFKIVLRANIEESLAVIVTNIFHSGEFKILTHHFNGIKLADSDGSCYLLLFDRRDINLESEVQYSVNILIYAEYKSKKEKELIALINIISNKHLIPQYKHMEFEIKEKNSVLGKIVFDLNQDVSNKLYSEVKNCIETLSCQNCKSSSDTGDDMLMKSQQTYEIIETEYIDTLEMDKVKKIIDKINNEIDTEKEVINNRLELYYSRISELRNDEKEKMVNVLHISDLHFSKDTNEENEVNLLLKDFGNVYFDNSNVKLNKNNIDYIVISGDMSNVSSPEEYKKVCNFLNKLCYQCNLSAEQIVIVPGNHDYSRDITYKSYEVKYDKKSDKENDFVINDKLYLKKIDCEWKKKFHNFSEYLYEYVYNHEYDVNTKNQLKIIKSELQPDFKIAFFMINTASDIDHFFPQRTCFDTKNLISNSININECEYIKIGVGHHPLNFENNIDFINALQNEGFKMYLHGHVHRDMTISYSNPQIKNNEMVVIGAGTFSADKHHMWQGVPQRYNIIKIEKTNDNDKKDVNIKVNTRQRESSNFYWQPANIYYDKKEDKMTNVWELENR